MIVLAIILSLFILGVLSIILDHFFTPEEIEIRREVPKNNYYNEYAEVIFNDDDLDF